MKVYKLKKRSEETHYIDFNNQLQEIIITPLNNLDFKLFGETENLSGEILFKLPLNTYKTFKSLLSYFELDVFENEFLTLMVLGQKNYLTYQNQDFNDIDLYNDFLNERKSLLKLIELLQFSKSNKESLKSISFKFSNDKKSEVIKNFFIVDDIYSALLSYYGLTNNNFENRKKELLSDLDRLKHNKGKDYIKSEIVNTIFNFIKSKKENYSDNRVLKFCGVFLHICQIPSNNKKNSQFDFDIENIEDAIELIDVQNMRHYKISRFSFF